MDTTGQVDLEYLAGDVGAGELQAFAGGVLSDLAADQAAMEELGLSGSDLDGLSIEIREREQGEAALVAIGIAIAGQVGAHVLKKLWDDLVHPRIVDRFGHGALRDP
jgi:hypothetical protein